MKDEVDLRMKGTACVAARSLSDPSTAVKRFHKSPFTVAAEGQGFYESSCGCNPTCKVRMTKVICTR